MQSLNEQAYDRLQSMILNNELSYRTIYSETKLAKDLNISRTPLRDAIHKLVQEGYIDIIPSKGFCLHRLSEKDVVETYQMRAALECYCTMEITKSFQSETAQTLFQDLDLLTEAMEDVMHDSHDIKEFFAYDFKFHLHIIKFINNQIFLNLFNSHMYRITRLAELSLEQEGRMESTCAEHRAILDAMKCGDVNNIYEITLQHMNNPQDINLEMLSNAYKAG